MYSNLYLNEIKAYSKKIDLSFLNNKTLCLSGGTGLIGSFLVDLVLIKKELNCKIILLVRNNTKAKDRFNYFANDNRLIIKEVNLLKEIEIEESIDYVLHLASLTDPFNYAHHPIVVMNTNYIGTSNLLELAKNKHAKFFLSSSCEVYGKNEKELIKEDDYGYIDFLDPRACYNESKKASETLCACYKKENPNMEIVIARLSRIYGPTMKLEDTKALSQFIVKTLNDENIVLKSKGEQRFNYTYVGDVCLAIIMLLKSKNEYISYNVTNTDMMSLKEIALFLASTINKEVVFDIPSSQEQSGYSKSLVSSLDPRLFEQEYKMKLETTLKEGLSKTLSILKENYSKK